MQVPALTAAVWRQNKLLPGLLALLLALNIVLSLSNAWVLDPRTTALQQQVLRMQTQVRDLEQSGVRLDSPRAIFRAGKQDLQIFNEMVPARGELSGLVAEIFSLARAAGLSIERITYDPQHLQEGALLSYALVFSVTGNYEQLKRFVFSLEHALRLIALDEIAFSAGDATKRTATLNLRMTTYFRADAT
jgi:type IV pilus assembly protein PilO